MKLCLQHAFVPSDVPADDLADDPSDVNIKGTVLFMLTQKEPSLLCSFMFLFSV